MTDKHTPDDTLDRTRTLDDDAAEALRLAARAVLDLAEGLGGDRQERDRAATIAFTLEQIANGQTPDPLLCHDCARRVYLAEARARTERERLVQLEELQPVAGEQAH